ncbi:transposase family protein, partial [Candidatus Sarmatiella mevalonica]|uniref:transposase family protein n=1 Tax=Candidatus Sarmatiella mevalonica TaxID=2770581 RepID=UPI001FC8E4D4
IIEKPIKKQREYFSGKKRKYTFKTEIRVNSFGQIRNVSKSYKGRDHDFKIHKAGDPLPIGTRVYADSGYQGLKKKHNNAKTPIKKTKKKPLTY